MMKTILFFFLYLISASQINCKAFDFSGKISHMDPGTRVRIYYYNNPFEGKEVGVETVLDSSGEFALSIKLVSPGMIIAEMGLNTFSFFADNSQSLIIAADAYEPGFLTDISGSAASNNKYILDEKRYGYGSFSLGDSFRGSCFEYYHYVDSLEERSRRFYYSSDTSKLTVDFRKYMEAELKYRYLNYRFSGWMNLKRRIDSAVADQCLQALGVLDLNDTFALSNPSYQTFLQNYWNTLLADSIRKSSEHFSDPEKNMKAQLRAEFTFILKKFSGKMIDHMLTHSMTFGLNLLASDKRFGDSLISQYKKNCKDTSYVNFISVRYKEMFRMQSGQPLPDMTFTAADGRRISLSSFKGSYVLIDFWATWCAPCIAALSRSQTLVDDERFQKLKFVYVNYDDREEEWRKYLRRNPSKGVQLIADNKESVLAQSLYEVFGLPHYILVDPKGKIVRSRFYWETAEDLLLIKNALQ